MQGNTYTHYYTMVFAQRVSLKWGALSMAYHNREFFLPPNAPKNKNDQWNDATNLSLKMQKSPKNKIDQWNHATNLSLKMQKSPKKMDQWNHATNLSLKMQSSPKKMINGLMVQIFP